MAKVAPIQGNFGGGEFSPLVQGRVDSDRYATGLEVCENWIPTIQGGITRRPGGTYVAATKDSTKKSRLIPFEYSTTQAYMLEFGDLYIRFYKNNGQVLAADGVTIYEISTGYSEAYLPDIKFTQSADVLYITHPYVAPSKLVRYADNNWSLQNLSITDGPYLPPNTTYYHLNQGLLVANNYTITPSAATGAGVTLTAGPAAAILGVTKLTSSTVQINVANHGYVPNQSLFVAGVGGGGAGVNGARNVTSVVDANNFIVDAAIASSVGAGGTVSPGLFNRIDAAPYSYVRLQQGSTWGWGYVTGITNTSVITVTVVSTFTSTAAKTVWRLPLWGGLNFPTCLTFHEDRLFFSGTYLYPQRIDASNTSDYENFSPTDSSGATSSSRAMSFTLNSNDVNAVKWMTSDEKGLLCGATGGEWVVRPSSATEALSPTNIAAKRTTSFGSANVQAIAAGKAAIFIQRAGRKVRELTYFYDVDGYLAPDISILAEHITAGGISQMAQQKEPQGIIWCLRGDGALIGMTYERSIDGLKVAFHRHIFGGQSDSGGTQAVVESVAAIPSSDGTRDEVWIIVKRYINGTTKRYVEYINKIFESGDRPENAKFLDCSLTYDSPKTITGITKANPGVVTSAGHGFSNGDSVLISEVSGMTEVNGFSFTIANVTANTFELGVDTSSYGTYISGGYVRKKVSTISGLSHLEGQTVSVFGDGAPLDDASVSGGSITLSNKAAVVTVGLDYNSDAQQLRLEAGAQNGTSIGKTRRTHRVGLLVERTAGISIGQSFDSLDEVIFRNTNEVAGQAVPLFSGITTQPVEFDYDTENRIAIRANSGLPATILAIMPQMDTQDSI